MHGTKQASTTGEATCTKASTSPRRTFRDSSTSCGFTRPTGTPSATPTSNDLSATPTYELFASSLRTCLQHCFDALAPGGRLAVLVGDVRRQGRYYPLIRDVLNLEGQLGTLRSVIIKAQHNCASDRRTYSAMEDVPIKHEYCIVFKK